MQLARIKLCSVMADRLKGALLLLLLRRQQYAAVARRCQIAAVQRKAGQLRLLSVLLRARGLQLVVVLLHLLLLRETERARRRRTEWTKPRSCRWWDQACLVWNDSEWKKNFRLTKATFLRLCADLRPAIAKDDTRFRKALPVEKRVAIALWRLSGNNEYRTIAHLFGVGTSTACTITNEVCRTIVRLLAAEYIQMPTGHRLRDVVRGFRDICRLPRIGGAVDGTHIPIVAPSIHPQDYYNRKSFYSVVLQGTVDCDLLFTNVFIGWPGRVHDARIFANSWLYRQGQAQGSPFSDGGTVNIHGIQVPVLILADAAYPLLQWVMKPFPDNGHLTREKAAFNARLSRGRIVVEQAFGLLKGRWRILLRQQGIHLENLCSIIAACCILHNYYIVHGDHADDNWLVHDHDGGGGHPAAAAALPVVAGGAGVAVRGALVRLC